MNDYIGRNQKYLDELKREYIEKEDALCGDNDVLSNTHRLKLMELQKLKETIEAVSTLIDYQRICVVKQKMENEMKIKIDIRYNYEDKRYEIIVEDNF